MVNRIQPLALVFAIATALAAAAAASAVSVAPLMLPVLPSGLPLGLGSQTTPLANCSLGGYDLSPLASSGVLTYVDAPSNFTYILTFCGLNPEPTCLARGGSMCQDHGVTNGPTSFDHTLVRWDGSAVWSNCTDPVACPQGGVQLFWNNGDRCGGAGPPRQVTIIVACSPGTTDTSSFVTAESTDNQCWYTATLSHAAGCPVGTGGGSGGNDNGKPGLSGGTIFVIILLVVTFVYVVFGCVYNRAARGLSGVEACPNYTFWSALPRYVADGARFVFTCGGKCGAGANESYDTVK